MNIKPNFILYLIAGILFFVFWLFVTFPYDAIQSRVITEIENQTEGKYKIDAKEMDFSLFGSITFEKLKVSERTGNGEKLLLNTPKFKLGFSPFAVLSKKIDFSFYLKGQKKGDIDGKYKQTGEDFALSLEFDEFPLTDLKFLSSMGGLGINGKLDGEVNMALNRTDPVQNQGLVDLNLVNLTMGPTKIALDPTDPSTQMDIPKITLSGSKGSFIKAEIKNNKLQINSIRLSGGDVDLNLDGSITLQGKSPGAYRVALKGGFKISEPLAKALPFLFILDKQKNDKGVYPLYLSGRLAKPNVRIGKFRLPI